jgi:hypothetical protein
MRKDKGEPEGANTDTPASPGCLQTDKYYLLLLEDINQAQQAL